MCSSETFSPKENNGTLVDLTLESVRFVSRGFDVSRCRNEMDVVANAPDVQRLRTLRSSEAQRLRRQHAGGLFAGLRIYTVLQRMRRWRKGLEATVHSTVWMEAEGKRCRNDSSLHSSHTVQLSIVRAGRKPMLRQLHHVRQSSKHKGTWQAILSAALVQIIEVQLGLQPTAS